MNLSKLKADVDHAVEHAEECGGSPDDITVSIQVDTGDRSVYSDDVDLHYDNDCQASGCVIVGVAPDPDKCTHRPDVYCSALDCPSRKERERAEKKLIKGWSGYHRGYPMPKEKGK